MKKFLTVFFVSVMVCMLFCGCKEPLVQEGNADEAISGITRSIYIYMSGGDAEKDYGSASETLREIAEVKLPENVRVIVETGGSNLWHQEGISDDKIERFEISYQKIKKVDSIDDENMGASKTLIDFLKWGIEKYPSADKNLIIWGQGGGSVGGVAYDARHDYDSLTPGEVAYALSRSGSSYSMIGFDACMMSSFEMASSIAPYASYMVASEEYQPCSWNYKTWLQYISENATAPTEKVCKAICDTFYNKCVDIGQEDTVAMAVTDLSKVSALIQAFEGLTSSLNTVPDSLIAYKNYAFGLKNVHYLGGKNADEGYSNMLDIDDFAKQVSSSANYDYNHISETIKDAVIHKVNGVLENHVSGISFFYPIRQNTDELKKYFDITLSSNYTDFLRRICSKTDLGSEDTDYKSSKAWNEYKNELAYMKYAAKVENNCYELNISGNMDIIDEVTLAVYKHDEKSGQYLYITEDTGLTIDRAAGIFKDDSDIRCITLNGHAVTADVIDKGDNYVLYSIPVYIDGVQGNIRASSITKNGKSLFKIYGFWRGINVAYGICDRNISKIKFSQYIEPFFKAYNDDNYYKPFRMFAGLKLIKIKDIPDGEYKAEFAIKDIYGNIIKADPSDITVTGGTINRS